MKSNSETVHSQERSQAPVGKSKATSVLKQIRSGLARPSLFLIFDSIRLLNGLRGARATDKMRRSMVRLYCLTGGWATDAMAKIVGLRHPKYPIAKAHGVLGALTESKQDQINQDLKDRGYHVFETPLSDEMIEDLLKFSLTETATLRSSDQDVAKGVGARQVLYRRDAPEGIRYDFKASQLMTNPTVQKLISDPSVLTVAQNYIGSAPILDIVTMWWNTVSKNPDSEAAQLYHFDMDNLRWLKFFFYVTDVGPDNGPHCFIEGTHRSGQIPSALRERGYARITDEEISAQFDPTKIKTFTGKRGTIIAEDTRGLHKGQHLKKGDRLVFQLQFSVSKTFATETGIRCPQKLEPQFTRALKEWPAIYQNLSRPDETTNL